MDENIINKAKKAIDETIAKYGEFHKETISRYSELANIYFESKEYELCHDCMLKIHKIIKQLYKESTPYGDSHIGFSIVSSTFYDKKQFEAIYQQFFKVNKILYGENHYKTLRVRVELIKVEPYQKSIEDCDALIKQLHDEYGEESIEYKEIRSLKYRIENKEQERKRRIKSDSEPFDPGIFDVSVEKIL